jgi:hypothetical protein
VLNLDDFHLASILLHIQVAKQQMRHYVQSCMIHPLASILELHNHKMRDKMHSCC